MHKAPNALVILVLLFVTTTGFADPCASEDNECKTNQSQLQALEKSGIKPSAIQKMDGSSPEAMQKTGVNQPVEPQPFKIPLPGFQQQETPDSQTPNLPDNTNSPDNTNTQNQNSAQEPPKFTFQPATSPLQPAVSTPASQATGIQYR